MERDRILELLRQSKPELMQRYPLHRMALFGSVARGDDTPESDVDILVDVDGSIGIRFVTLADQLEEILGRKVDLVSRRSLKPSLMAVVEPDLIYV